MSQGTDIMQLLFQLISQLWASFFRYLEDNALKFDKTKSACYQLISYNKIIVQKGRKVSLDRGPKFKIYTVAC